MRFPSSIAFYVGSWPIHWYGISYMVGILLTWSFVRYILKKHTNGSLIEVRHIDGFLDYAVLGIILGGRFGHVVLYEPWQYLQHPLSLLKVWEGGLSFHGGLIGSVLASWIYCKKRGLPWISFCDAWARGVPIGLFFGRLANFVNQELYGKMTTLPWGVVFPKVDAISRHPSQLYEAFLEGICLWVVLQCRLDPIFRAAKSTGIRILIVSILGYYLLGETNDLGTGIGFVASLVLGISFIGYFFMFWAYERFYKPVKTKELQTSMEDKSTGKASGMFLMGYAVVRWICEYFREPLETYGPLHLGQWYSIPMMMVGALLYTQRLQSFFNVKETKKDK